ncbi:MAG: cation diffusion facilitator family transporter [Thermomicrobiales bacterium]
MPLQPSAPGHDDTDGDDSRQGEGQSSRTAFKPIAIALGITAAFMAIEAIGGFLTNSLALIADAGHMATDVAALGFSLFAIRLAQRPPTPRRSFGYLRAEVLAAFINSAFLIGLTFIILWEAFLRLNEPPEVHSGPMLIVAVAGLIANLCSAWVLSRGGAHQHNLNMRGAFIHVVSDALGSVGAIAAALIMLATGWYLADPILSGGIGLLILWSSWKLLSESVDVLLEAGPKEIDPETVSKAATEIPGVEGLHDLHIWTVTSGMVAMSAHVSVDDFAHWAETCETLNHLLEERFGIAHVTLQPETLDTSHPPDDFAARTGGHAHSH